MTIIFNVDGRRLLRLNAAITSTEKSGEDANHYCVNPHQFTGCTGLFIGFFLGHEFRTIR